MEGKGLREGHQQLEIEREIKTERGRDKVQSSMRKREIKREGEGSQTSPVSSQIFYCLQQVHLISV